MLELFITQVRGGHRAGSTGRQEERWPRGWGISQGDLLREPRALARRGYHSGKVLAAASRLDKVKWKQLIIIKLVAQ